MNNVAEFLQKLDVLDMSLAKLDGVDGLVEVNDRRRVAGGVLQQLPQPGAFQAQANAQDHVGVSNGGDVTGSGLIVVRVRSLAQKAGDFNVTAADILNPVGNDVRGGDHLQSRFRRHSGSDRGGGWRCRRAGWRGVLATAGTKHRECRKRHGK